MRYRSLGDSGCSVSELCLGTMTFGAESDEAVAHAQLDRFVEAGGTLVDTADVYSAGASEAIIGRWLGARPPEVTDSVVLATKGRFPMGTDPNDSGLSARHLTLALDASLRRLAVESVDLYQVHSWDPWTPLAETLRTLNGFVRSGKIRYHGLSNFSGWQLTKAVHTARTMGLTEPVTLQPQLSLICARSSGRSFRQPSTRAWACSRGARWVAVGSVASTSATSVPRDSPGSVRTRRVAWRPGTAGAPSARGRSSRPSNRSRSHGVRQWPRWPCPG